MLSPDAAPSSPNSAASFDSASPAGSDESEVDIKDELRHCLSSMKHVGEVMSYQTTQSIIDPGLYVKGVGNISLPLDKDRAAAILEKTSQAPFGRGSKTVVDTSFRDTQQLDPSRFRLRNPAWEQNLQNIIKTLGQGLGVQESPSGIKAELYKLLLYKKGDKFQPHKDSEKADGMFATLVICLPTLHKGGDVILQHRGRAFTVKSSENSEFGQTHIAWYSDVLEHDYSQANLRFDRLKGRDRLLGQYLRDGCEKEDFTILLANLNVTVYHAEPGDDYGDRTPARHLKLTNLTDLHDKVLLDNVPLDDDEIVQFDPFDRSPDKVTTEETGNEGTDVTHFYHDSVIIIMPYAYKLQFSLANLDDNDVIRWIEDVIGQGRSDFSPHMRDLLTRGCQFEAHAFARVRKGRTGVLTKCVTACEALQDQSLLHQCVQGCYKSQLGSGFYKAFLETLRTFDFDDIRPSFDMLISRQPSAWSSQLNILLTFGDHFQSRASSDQPIPQWPKYEAWEKPAIIWILDGVHIFDYKSVDNLVKLVKGHDETFSVEV
ncbi:MAG: hypothetical protein Q9222_006781 [Ikaeria aurantiellina]